VGEYYDQFEDGIFPGADWSVWAGSGSFAESDGRLRGESAVNRSAICNYNKWFFSGFLLGVDWETDFPQLDEGQNADLLLAVLSAGAAVSIGRRSEWVGDGHGRREIIYARCQKNQIEVGREEVVCDSGAGTFFMMVTNETVSCYYVIGGGDPIPLASFSVDLEGWYFALSLEGQNGAFSAGYYDNFIVESDGFKIDSLTPDITSLHAAEILTVKGVNLGVVTPTVTVGGEACVVEAIDGGTIRATTPQLKRTGDLEVLIALPNPPGMTGETATAKLSVRDRILKILLAATERAWSPTPASVGYRVLAAIAAGKERARALSLAMFDELFPETATDKTGLPWFERDLALSERPELSELQRRARVRAKLNEQPSIAVAAVLAAIRPYCVDDPIINEVEGYEDYGDSIWTLWFEVDDDDINNPAWNWRGAEDSLRSAKPGFAGGWIGRRGFIPGTSIPGRDVPVEV
jgi:hypothetical protein